MKALSNIQNYEKFKFLATIVPKSPDSGFSLSFGTSGEAGFTTGARFYGRSGLVFDQENNFFGGYYSGRSLDIEGHFFGNRLSYLYNGTLINNNIPLLNNFNCIEFEKLNDSELNVVLNYVSGLRDSESGLVDSGGTFLLSSDGFYLLPSV